MTAALAAGALGLLLGVRRVSSGSRGGPRRPSRHRPREGHQRGLRALRCDAGAVGSLVGRSALRNALVPSRHRPGLVRSVSVWRTLGSGRRSGGVAGVGQQRGAALGDVTMHHGWWVHLDEGAPQGSWCWIPGAAETAGRVVWRTADGYVGWAPEPPSAAVDEDADADDLAWTFSYVGALFEDTVRRLSPRTQPAALRGQRRDPGKVATTRSIPRATTSHRGQGSTRSAPRAPRSRNTRRRIRASAARRLHRQRLPPLRRARRLRRPAGPARRRRTRAARRRWRAGPPSRCPPRWSSTSRWRTTRSWDREAASRGSRSCRFLLAWSTAAVSAGRSSEVAPRPLAQRWPRRRRRARRPRTASPAAALTPDTRAHRARARLTTSSATNR